MFLSNYRLIVPALILGFLPSFAQSEIFFSRVVQNVNSNTLSISIVPADRLNEGEELTGEVFKYEGDVEAVKLKSPPISGSNITIRSMVLKFIEGLNASEETIDTLKSYIEGQDYHYFGKVWQLLGKKWSFSFDLASGSVVENVDDLVEADIVVEKVGFPQIESLSDIYQNDAVIKSLRLFDQSHTSDEEYNRNLSRAEDIKLQLLELVQADVSPILGFDKSEIGKYGIAVNSLNNSFIGHVLIRNKETKNQLEMIKSEDTNDVSVKLSNQLTFNKQYGLAGRQSLFEAANDYLIDSSNQSRQKLFAEVMTLLPIQLDEKVLVDVTNLGLRFTYPENQELLELVVDKRASLIGIKMSEFNGTRLSIRL